MSGMRAANAILADRGLEPHLIECLPREHWVPRTSRWVCRKLLGLKLAALPGPSETMTNAACPLGALFPHPVPCPTQRACEQRAARFPSPLTFGMPDDGLMLLGLWMGIQLQPEQPRDETRPDSVADIVQHGPPGRKPL